jgi:hypothetical protein
MTIQGNGKCGHPDIQDVDNKQSICRQEVSASIPVREAWVDAAVYELAALMSTNVRQRPLLSNL